MNEFVQKIKLPDELQYHLDHERLRKQIFDSQDRFFGITYAERFQESYARWVSWQTRTRLTESERSCSYFALRARLRGFYFWFDNLKRSRIIYMILQHCRHCDMSWSHDSITDDVCNSCQDLTN